mmetsp:Transcript_16165/g.49095  ORF Transcript_16165/g.49095 Transcript_16165/m.49095 type:complete len:209 (-) Transcript_16165:173-799(-)
MPGPLYGNFDRPPRHGGKKYPANSHLRGVRTLPTLATRCFLPNPYGATGVSRRLDELASRMKVQYAWKAGVRSRWSADCAYTKTLGNLSRSSHVPIMLKGSSLSTAIAPCAVGLSTRRCLARCSHQPVAMLVLTLEACSFVLSEVAYWPRGDRSPIRDTVHTHRWTENGPRLHYGSTCARFGAQVDQTFANAAVFTAAQCVRPPPPLP